MALGTRAESADAGTARAGLGVLFSDPDNCLSFANAQVSNDCNDGAAAVPGWYIPLTMDTTGSKNPTVYAFQQLFAPTDVSRCRGTRFNSHGVLQWAGSWQTFYNGNNSLAMGSTTMAAGDTYVVACYIGGLNKVYGVSYAL